MIAVEDKYGIGRALQELGIADENKGSSTGQNWLAGDGEIVESVSPVDNRVISRVEFATAATYEEVIKRAEEAFQLRVA